MLCYKNVILFSDFLSLLVGYNPINGEAYSNKDNAKQPDSTVKTTEEEKGNGQAAPTNDNVHTENGSAQAAPTNSTENGNAQAAATNTAVNGNAQKPVEKVDNAANGDNAQKVSKNLVEW